MRAQRTSAARTWQVNATPYKHIRIISHRPRKNKKHIIAVKAITFSAALLAVYGLLLLEFHPGRWADHLQPFVSLPSGLCMGKRRLPE